MNPKQNKRSIAVSIANTFTILGVLWSVTFIIFMINQYLSRANPGDADGWAAFFYGLVIFASLGLVLLLNLIFAIIQAVRKGPRVKQALLTIVMVLFALIGTAAILTNI